jgi:hypothetical protein
MKISIAAISVVRSERFHKHLILSRNIFAWTHLMWLSKEN